MKIYLSFLMISCMFTQDSIFTHVIHDIFIQNYESAYQRLNHVKEKTTRQFLKLTIDQSKLQDYQSFDEKELDTFESDVEALINSLGNSENLNDKKVLGQLYFLYGAEEKRRGHFYSAFNKANSGRDLLEDVLEIEPDNKDIILPLGLFMYWKSVETRWVPFFSDEEEEGLNLVKLVLKNGTYSKPSAQQQMIYVLMHQKKYAEAVRLAEKSIQEMPESRIFKWAYAYSLRKEGSFRRAFHLFQELNAYYTQHRPSYNTIETQYKMALCELDLGNKKIALKLLKKISDKNLDSFTMDLISDKLDRINELIEELESE